MLSSGQFFYYPSKSCNKLPAICTVLFWQQVYTGDQICDLTPFSHFVHGIVTVSQWVGQGRSEQGLTMYSHKISFPRMIICFNVHLDKCFRIISNCALQLTLNKQKANDTKDCQYLYKHDHRINLSTTHLWNSQHKFATTHLVQMPNGNQILCFKYICGGIAS